MLEIDPVVYEFAREYFALPYPNGGAVLEDARKYLARKSALKFDYIVSSPLPLAREHQADTASVQIHDVFTGGTLPASVFTNETFAQLRSRLQPWGTLAVNYAGSLTSPIGNSVIHTLSSSFPSCRAFSADGPPAALDSDKFQNVVFFCSALGEEVKLRKPVRADYLADGASAASRKTILDNLFQWEFPHGWQEQLGQGGLLLQDGKMGGMTAVQEKVAEKHFELMRAVLPDQAWADFY